MKNLILTLAIALMGLCAVAQIDTIDVTSGARTESPAKVVGVRVLSSVASGTAQVKSVSTLPVIVNVDHVNATTNHTYTYVYTNGTQTVTNTVDHLPLPLGPTVTSYVTNNVVTYHTNSIPTTTSTVVVTNLIGGAITCSGGVGIYSPTNTYLIPGEPIFYTGTAKGRVLLIVER